MSLEAIIFDLDGLLVDSEPLQFRAYREAFASCGVRFEQEDWTRFHDLEASASRWIEHNGIDVDPEAVRSKKKGIYERLIQTELKLKPGASELVEALTRKFRLCVASSSRPESIDVCLRKFGLETCFEGLVSAVELPRKKPHPDVYFAALAHLNLSADAAIAIEDSVAGLRAATLAGLRCVVCPDSFVPTDHALYDEAVLVVDSLGELDEARLCSINRFVA